MVCLKWDKEINILIDSEVFNIPSNVPDNARIEIRPRKLLIDDARKYHDNKKTGILQS